MSGRAFGERDGFYRRAYGEDHALDLPPLLPMIAEAWAADYAGDIRMDFDAEFFARMCATPGWIAVVAFESGGRPVGFEIGIQRTLRLGRNELHAYYVTAFSGAPQYRRQGIGRWVLEGINELVFMERGADLIFSTFHLGHAGSPTVQSTYDAISDYGVCRFSTSPLYGLRLSKWKPPPHDRVRGERLVLDDAGKLRLADTDRAAPLSRDALAGALGETYEAAFTLDGSFGALYLAPESKESGGIWYEFGEDRWCWITYAFLGLAIDHTPIGRCGQVQTVASRGLQEAELEAAMIDTLHRFADLGCTSAIMLDQGAVPADSLARIGLAPTDTEICFSARGPADVVRGFEDAGRPYLLDFV